MIDITENRKVIKQGKKYSMKYSKETNGSKYIKSIITCSPNELEHQVNKVSLCVCLCFSLSLSVSLSLCVSLC